MAVSFGAIRWDAWWSLAAGSPANETRNTLSDSEYQFRAPIHSQVLGNNVITYNCTQQKFDDEITFANSCGLHYWAYLMYSNGSSMNAGLDFHVASSIKNQQKYALIVPTDGMGTTGNYTSTIDTFVNKYVDQSCYYILPSGKPLLFVYYTAADIASRWSGNIANFKTALDYLRSKFLAIKGSNPYVMILCGADDSVRIALAANGVTNYISGFSRVLNGSYATLATSTVNYWTTMANAVSGSGGHIAPICMIGWNSAPRKRRVESFQITTQYPEHGLNYNYALPTNSELVSHVQAAVNYVNTNTTLCPEKVILTYAWNENDEGGWLTKTLGDPTGSRLQAIAPVIA